MILEILTKITNKIQTFTLEEKEYIEILLHRGIINNTNNTFELSKKYKIGKINILNNIIKLHTINDIKQNIFIHTDDLKNSYHNDIVLVKIIFNPRGRLKAKVIEILSKNDIDILCYFKDDNIYDFKNHSQINLAGSKKELKQNDIFLIKDAKINEYIGNIDDPSIDEKISLYLYSQVYRIKTSYSTKVQEIKDYSKRVDLTSLNFCTIDPASAKDHDDAIYFDEKNLILYVAIADVSAYIAQNSSLDIQAKNRAFSIYLPNKVLPMIPFELSANLCSLKPDVKRLSYVMKMQINEKSLTVKNSELIQAVIISKNKYSYEQIDEYIDNKTLPDSLSTLYNITSKIRKRRLKDGYDFRTKEYRLILDKNEELTNINEEQSSPSHKLVEECMLLANIQAAKKLENTGIFRIHEEPSRKNIEELLHKVNLLGLKIKLKKDIHSTIESIQNKAENANLIEEVDKLIIQSQQQARYSSGVDSHFGLGFLHYSHFTSPIRRYSDLVLHRILKSHQTPQDIDDICSYISTQEREISKLVWDLEARKYTRWALAHINEVFDAKITDIEDNPKGEFSSQMIGLRFEIENYQSEQLFTDVTVQIISADIIKKQIICKII